MTEFTHLNDIVVQGSVSSSEQGDLIGSFKSMPKASADNKDKIVLYTGETTGTFRKGMYYISNGSAWVLSEAPLYSTNDYTSEDKAKLDGIATGAQVNVIETVKVNGATQAVVNKAVNISVPTSYGFKLQVNTSTGVISLLDKQGVVLSTINTTINRVIKSGYYDTASGNIVLVTDDNTQINIPVSDLVDTYAADGTYLTLDERTFSLSGSAKAAVDAVANKAEDSAVVHKTGSEDVAGTKRFDDVRLRTPLTLEPTSYLTKRLQIINQDTGDTIGYYGLAGDGTSTRTYISVFRKVNGETVYSDLQAHLMADGTKYALAPSWSVGTADNSDKILTTKMANSLPSLVHTTGNETIAGEKTFTSRPVFLLNSSAGFIADALGIDWTNTFTSFNRAFQITARDKNGVNVSIIQSYIESNDRRGLSLDLYGKSGNTCSLALKDDGTIQYATAPATPDTAPDTAIVTKKYLLDKIAALEARIATLEAKP